MTKGLIKDKKPRRDLTGKVFNMLHVMAYAGSRGYKHYWHCRCYCGGVALVQTECLVYGGTKSCGCLQRRRHRKNIVLVDGDISYIELRRYMGEKFLYSLIDTSMCEKVQQHNWCARAFRCVRTDTKEALGRFVWRHAHGNLPDAMYVWHKNGNSLDNRLCNLFLRRGRSA